MFSITLADGSSINNLTRNGSLFCSDNPSISRDTFKSNLQHVSISAGSDATPEDRAFTGSFDNMRLAYFKRRENGCEFIINPIPEQELQALQTQSDIDYIAMMTGVTL